MIFFETISIFFFYKLRNDFICKNVPFVFLWLHAKDVEKRGLALTYTNSYQIDIYSQFYIICMQTMTISFYI